MQTEDTHPDSTVCDIGVHARNTMHPMRESSVPMLPGGRRRGMPTSCGARCLCRRVRRAKAHRPMPRRTSVALKLGQETRNTITRHTTPHWHGRYFSWRHDATLRPPRVCSSAHSHKTAHVTNRCIQRGRSVAAGRNRPSSEVPGGVGVMALSAASTSVSSGNLRLGRWRRRRRERRCL